MGSSLSTFDDTPSITQIPAAQNNLSSKFDIVLINQQLPTPQPTPPPISLTPPPPPPPTQPPPPPRQISLSLEPPAPTQPPPPTFAPTRVPTTTKAPIKLVTVFPPYFCIFDDAGNSWKYDVINNRIRLDSNKYPDMFRMPMSIYNDSNVFNNSIGRVGLKNENVDGYIRHSGLSLRSDPFIGTPDPLSHDFAWFFIKDDITNNPKSNENTYKIGNDFIDTNNYFGNGKNYYIGYENDEVKIVANNENSLSSVKSWTIISQRPPMYITGTTKTITQPYLYTNNVPQSNRSSNSIWGTTSWAFNYTDSTINTPQGWTPQIKDYNTDKDKAGKFFLTLKLNNLISISGVLIQGSGIGNWSNQFVTKFYISYQDLNESWNWINSSPNTKTVFNGLTSNDGKTTIAVYFNNRFLTKAIKIYPIEWNNNPTMRADVILDDTSFALSPTVPNLPNIFTISDKDGNTWKYDRTTDRIKLKASESANIVEIKMSILNNSTVYNNNIGRVALKNEIAAGYIRHAGFRLHSNPLIPSPGNSAYDFAWFFVKDISSSNIYQIGNDYSQADNYFIGYDNYNDEVLIVSKTNTNPSLSVKSWMIKDASSTSKFKNTERFVDTSSIILNTPPIPEIKEYSDNYNRYVALLDDPNQLNKAAFDTFMYIQNKKINNLQTQLASLPTQAAIQTSNSNSIKAIKNLGNSHILNVQEYPSATAANNGAVSYPNYLIYGNNGCLQYDSGNSTTLSFQPCNANNQKQQFYKKSISNDKYNINPSSSDSSNCLQLNSDGLSVMPCDSSNTNIAKNQQFSPLYRTVMP